MHWAKREKEKWQFPKKEMPFSPGSVMPPAPHSQSQGGRVHLLASSFSGPLLLQRMILLNVILKTLMTFKLLELSEEGHNKMTGCAAFHVATRFYNYKKTSCYSNCFLLGMLSAQLCDPSNWEGIWFFKGFQPSLGWSSLIHSNSQQPGPSFTLQSDRPGLIVSSVMHWTVWPWASHLTSISLSFYFCKMGMAVPTTWENHCDDSACDVAGTTPGMQ